MRAGLFLTLLLALGATRARAQVLLVPDRIDLGELLQMDRREFELEVTNAGADLLTRARLDHDCGCLRILSGAGSGLAPGASTTLRVELRTELLEGPQRKEIHWGAGTAVVAFRVEPDFVIEPESCRLGDLKRGAVGEGSVLLRARPGLEAELVLLQAPPHTGVRIESLAREPGAAAAWRLHLRREVSPKARAGAFEEVVIIEPRGARVPLIQIGVFGRVSGLVEARPSVADFGRVPGGDVARARLRLESRDGRPFRVLGYRILGRAVACEEVVEPALSPEIEIEIELGGALGPQRGILDLILDHPGEKTISLAWRARVIERKP